MRKRKVIAAMLAGAMLSIPVLAAVDFSVSDKDKLMIQRRANFKTAVWSQKNGQDDLIWYDCQNMKEGIQTQIDLSSRDYGRYYAHTYMFTEGEKPVLLFTDELFVEEEPTFLVHKDDNEVQIHAFGYPYREVAAVWSEKNGQDDLKWYWMSEQPTTISKKHIDGSKVFIHLYGYDETNTPHFLGHEEV